MSNAPISNAALWATKTGQSFKNALISVHTSGNSGALTVSSVECHNFNGSNSYIDYSLALLTMTLFLQLYLL